MNKDYFSVDEIAEKIGVHTKTVRRYIYSGKLSATKIAGQWRITQESLDTFMDQGCCTSTKEDGVSKDDFCIFMDTDHFASDDLIQICTIVDYFVEEQKEVEALARDVMTVVTTMDTSGKSKFNYVYDDSEKKARFVFWGTPAFIEALMKALKKYA